MPNPTQLYAALCDAAYQGEGVARGIRDSIGYFFERQHLADDLEVNTFAPTNGTGAATVVATQAVRIYGVEIISAGSAGFLTFYNAAAATVGVTAIHMVVPFGATESTFIPFYKSSYDGVFGTGCTIGTVTAVATSTAIGTAVTKVVIVSDAAP